MGKILRKGDQVEVEMSLDEMLLKRPILSKAGAEGPYFGELLANTAFEILNEVRPDLAGSFNGVVVEGKGKMTVIFLVEKNLEEYANG